MFVYLDYNNAIKAISDSVIQMDNCTCIEWPDLPESAWHKLIGHKISASVVRKQLRVAIICNWDQPCGISTYSRYLVESLRPLVGEIRIFSEHGQHVNDEAVYCWSRGESMQQAMSAVKGWQPDFVIVQHEFGLFPRATYFLQMLQELEGIPYVVAFHSIYQHLDKSVCTSVVPNIVVHSEEAKKTLVKIGNDSRIFVVPHGCVPVSTQPELWNIFQTPYCMIQFGFGFFYKGVDVALDAIAHLKRTKPHKYKDIFYCYLCSGNSNTNNIHNNYYEFLRKQIEELELQDNAVIIRKYQTEENLSHYLRTAKLAIFPYLTDPDNTVYGASGAIRIAMSHNIPVIASPSHLFDDLEGIVPRPCGHEALAEEIDRIFSSKAHRQKLIRSNHQFIEQNLWPDVASQYLDIYEEIR